MQPLRILLMVVPGDPLGTKVALPGGGQRVVSNGGGQERGHGGC